MGAQKYDLDKISKQLKKELDESRFRHTEGVMYTAAAMAMAHGVDMHIAQTAGLLHDCAKCIPNKKKLEMCRKNQIPMSGFEVENPFLLHAKLGAFLAKTKYHVSDSEILRAIAWHTTGKPDMTKLEQIVYIADYIEPGRDKAPNLKEIRKLAFTDLDECMYWILKDTIEYLKSNPKSMDETTEKAYLYYREHHNNKEE